MNKKILYLTYDGLTDPIGQSQILPYIKGLSKLGYQFTILSCDKPDRYALLKDTINALCKEDNIDWVSVPFRKSPPVLSKILDRRQFKNTAIKLQKEKNFDLIHCRSYISAEIGLYLKRQYGCKFLFDMRGFWADEKIDGGNWNIKNPLFRFIYKFYKKKEKEFLENADYTVSLTHAGKKEMHRWKHISNNPVKVEVIPCCVDTDHFDADKIDSREQKNWKVKLGIADTDFVLAYLGSIGTWYMLSEMLDFFKTFSTQKPNAKFLLITGDEHKLIRSTALQKEIPTDKIIIQKGQRNEVPTLLSLCSLSIFFIRPTYSKTASSPIKQGEIMSMGIPILCNSGVGDSDDIVNNYHSGLLVSDLTTESYQVAIGRYNESSFSPLNLRKGAVEYFSLKSGIEKYADVYRRIFTRSQ